MITKLFVSVSDINCLYSFPIFLSFFLTGSALSIDPKIFLDGLYQLLLRVPLFPSTIHIALSCVEHLLLRRKEVSLDRVSSFFRRLGFTALSLDVQGAVPTVALMRQILQVSFFFVILDISVDR